MTVKERLLALKLMEKQEKHPEYARRIGIWVTLYGKDPEERKEKHV